MLAASKSHMVLPRLILVGNVLLAAVAVYGGMGVLFAAAFVVRGVRRIDPGSLGAGISFRLLILPGAAALWPWLLTRWIRTPETTR